MYNNLKYQTNIRGDHTGIHCDIDGVPSFVPIDPANSDYQRIMALVDAGELTIADPD